jgi:hypothetical protein
MTPVATVPPTAPEQPVTTVPDQEIRIYGHNNLFYWWPVWAVAFLFALLTYLDRHVMAVVPYGTQVEQAKVADGSDQSRQVLVPPPGQPVTTPSPADGDPNPKLLVSPNNNYGVVFVAVILLVAVVSNILLRGLASVIAVAAILVVVLFVAVMGWWNEVLSFLGGLDVRINAGGYLVLAVPLFLIWLFSTFVYDHYTYVIVTRGQVRIRQAIGDGEQVVDTSSLLLSKERNDLFRHWILGLGSGDLIIKTGGPANINFELFNVLFIEWKLAKIQDFLREKEVAEQGPGA